MKKIVSVVSSILLLVTPAAALYTLDQYPFPFVDKGELQASIVIGKNAMAEDVIGAVNIAAQLQYAMRQTTNVSVGASEITIDMGIKAKGTGKETLNYGEYVGTVKSSALDEADLPSLLAKDRIKESKGNNKNDETYTQRLKLSSTNAQAVHDQPDDGYDANDYLVILDNTPLYNYTLEFDDSLEFDATSQSTVIEDFQGTSFDMQGQRFTITDAKKGTDGRLAELRIQAGDTILWLTQEQVIEKTVNGVTHLIKVVDVTTTQDACGVSVDGDLAWIDVNSDETINGITVSVLEAKAVHAELQDVDICQINIGATEIVLKDEQNVEIDGKDIDGTESDLKVSNPGSGEWNGFSIVFTPDENMYLTKGQQFVDPTFQLWKIVMEGVLTERETISWATSGSSGAALKFKNNEGKDVEVPVHFSSSYPTNAMDTQLSLSDVLYWGKDDDKPMLVDDGDTGADASYGSSGGEANDFFICGASSGSITECDGVLIWYVTSGGTAHVLQIKNVDTDNVTNGAGTMDIKDLTGGKQFDDRKYIDAGSSSSRDNVTNLDLGSLGTLSLYLYESAETGGTENAPAGTIAISSAVNNAAQTDFGAYLQLNPTLNIANKTPQSTEALAIEISENDVDDSTITDDNGLTDLGPNAPSGAGEGQLIQLSTWYDTSDSRVETGFGADGNNLNDRTSNTPTTGVNTWPRAGYDKKDDDSDVRYSSTAHGTLVEYDDEDEKWVKVWYPKEEVEVNAFVAPVSASTALTGGSIQTTSLKQIPITATKLDEDVTDVTKEHLIVIGGPCVNTVAAKLSGDPQDCASGFKEGSAIIKLIQNGEKVAMLVAGYSSTDTRRATNVIAHPQKYPGLKGMEVEVKGSTSDDGIVVGK